MKKRAIDRQRGEVLRDTFRRGDFCLAIRFTVHYEPRHPQLTHPFDGGRTSRPNKFLQRTLMQTTPMKTHNRRSSQPRRRIVPLAASVATLLLGAATHVHAQGVFSTTGSLGTGNNDANVGLLSTKTYFDAVNLLGGSLSINGVSFAASSGGNPAGSTYAISGVGNTFGGGGTNPGGVLGSLTNDFIYGGNPGVFTLNNLTAGQTYILTFYDRSWEGAGNRFQTIVASSGASTVFDEDVGAAGQGELNLLRYTFTASSTSETLNFVPQASGNTMHMYGFSTEQVFNNAWSSGGDWTTSTWGAPGVPNSAGSNANFAAQGAPTAINLNANQTVGHVQFDGANAWTLSTNNASTLTLQADVGGVSVVSAKTGSHTISAPVTFASNIMKSGAGTVVLSGAINDAGKNIAISAGTLEIANGAAQTLNSVMTGAGSLAKSGAGTLTLTRSEYYTGNTVITGGVLMLQQATAGTVVAPRLANSNGYTFSPANNNLLAGLTPTAVTNGSAGAEGTGGTGVLTNGAIPAFSFASSYTVGNSAVLTYSLGSSPTGYDLTAVNLFSGWQDTGRSTINLANLSYSTVAAPGTFITIGGTGDNFAGGAANLASFTAPGGVLATGVSSIRFNFGASQQNGYVGYRELEVVGTVTGGVLPTGTAVQIASGASLDINGVTQMIGSLADSGGGGGAVINSAASTPVTLTVNPTSGSTTFSGTISDAGSANAIGLLKSGNGTQVLSGTNSTYSGFTTFVGGILNVASLADYGNNSSLGNRASDSGGGNVGLLFRGGTLQYTGSTAQSTNRSIRISTVGGATIDASGSNPSATVSFTATTSPDFYENGGNRTLTLTGSNTGNNTFAMGITQTGGVTNVVKSGVGTWVLPSVQSYTGATTVNGGTLRLTGGFGGTTLGVITVAGSGTTQLNIEAGTYTQGSGGLFVGNTTGAGIVNQTGGAVSWNNGGLELLIGNGGAGTYNLSGGSLTTATATVRGVMLGVNTNSTATFNLSGSGILNTTNSLLEIGRSDATGSSATTNLFSQTGGTATAGTLTLGGNAGDSGNNMTISATLSLTGGTFSATNFPLNAASGGTTTAITVGGTAQVTLPVFPTARGNGGGGSTATITFDSTTGGGGFLAPTAASAVYMPAGSFTHAYLTANGANFNVGSGKDITVDQVLENNPSATGTLTKSGAGALTLTGVNSYTGVTSVSNGTLNVSGAGSINSSSGVTINGSAARFVQTSSVAGTNGVTLTQGTLDGTGTVGAVSVDAAGSAASKVVANGNLASSTALTLGSLVYNGTGTASLRLPGGGTVSSPGLAVTGALTVSGGAGSVIVNITPESLLLNGSTYQLMSYGGAFTGTASSAFTLAPGVLSGRQSGAFASTAASNGFITLAVAGDNPAWSGAAGSALVQNAPNSALNTGNLALKTNHTATDFWTNDFLEFNDTYNAGAGDMAVTQTTVNIAGGATNASGIAPLVVTFNNSAIDYTLVTSDNTGITAGSVIKNGTGTANIGTNNSYSGATAINNGVLNLTGSLTGGTAISTSGSGILTQASTGIISGASAVTLAGTGTSVLGGTNSYTGATSIGDGTTLSLTGSLTGGTAISTVGSGVLDQSSTGAISGASSVTLTGMGTSVLGAANTYTGATSIGDGTTLSLTGSLTGGTAISTAGSGALNQSSTGIISGASSLALAGSGTSVLGGTNSYTGATVIGTGTTLMLTGSVAGTAISTAGSGVLNESSTGVISGAISVTLAGTGISTLGGSNSYSGVTAITGGILNVATFSDYGFDGGLGNRTFSADVSQNIGILFRGGTLQYTGSTPQSTNRAIRISTVGGAFIDASGSVPTATLSFTGTSSPDFFENPGTRTLTLTGTNTGDNTFAMSIVDQGGNRTALVKNGIGTWLLTGSNTFSGQTYIYAGALRMATSSALGAGGFDGNDMTHVYSGGALELQGSITVNEHFHFVGPGPAGLGSLRSVSGNNTLTTNFAMDGDSNVGVDTGSLTVAAVIYNDTGAPKLTKVGNGTLFLNGANSYNGGTAVTAGTLNINSDGALGATGTAVSISNNAVLQAGGTVTTSSRTLTVDSGGGTIDTNGNTVTYAVGSTVTDGGMGNTLTKTGNGTLNLNGVQTYGTLTTSGGTTNVNSALGTGTSTLNANATTNIGASQTLAALNIGAGAVVTFGDGPFAFGFDEAFAGSPAAGAVVPEPGSLGLLLVGVLSTLARRPKRERS
jgi:autotransporter-associated beta strand protein